MWLENGVLWLKTNSQPKLFQSCSFSSFYRGEEVCSRALRPQLSIQPQHALLWRARVQTSGSVPHLPGGPFVLGMPSPLALGPPATGLAQACPAQMLVVLVFLPSPPPLPVVAKLHQKKKKKNPSALSELFHFHNFPGGREASGWQFKKDKLADWLLGPHGIPGDTCLCSQTQEPYARVYSCPGRVSACRFALLTPFSGAGPSQWVLLPPLSRLLGRYHSCP